MSRTFTIIKKCRPVFSVMLYWLFSISGSYAQTFNRPGAPFTRADLAQLKADITREPWLSAYNAFKADARSSLNYTMQGPMQTVSRAPNLNNSQWMSDMRAIHNLTFMYVFTGDSAYARKATNILDAWAVTNTVWGGTENLLDIGDLAPYYVPAADILRSTFPGWSAANDAHVRSYFSNVLYPTSGVPGGLRDHNKGAIQLATAIGIAAYLGDPVKWQQAIEVCRIDAGGGLRNSLPNGEVGDSGRDDHWWVQIASLGWCAEVAWKQGIDLFAEFDDRILAMAELYNRYAIAPEGLTFIPFGGYSAFYTNWGIPTGFRKTHPFNNIVQAAYQLRKGLPTPFTSQMRSLGGENSWSFLYLKSADTSTARKLPPLVFPGDDIKPAGALSNIDIGNTGLRGASAQNNGIWTVTAAGNNPVNASNFTFRKVKGDVGMVVKVTGNSLNTASAGLMIRESLAPDARNVYINLYAAGTIKNIGGGYTHFPPKMPWWLKIERIGERIFTYHSPDGVNWTNFTLTITPYPNDTYIGFYAVSNNLSAKTTATFTNVALSDLSAAGTPVITSPLFLESKAGIALTYPVTASGSPILFKAAGLPAGLRIDSLTGVISGLTTMAGTYAVDIEAANAIGTGNATLMLRVSPGQRPEPPILAGNVLNATQVRLSWNDVPGAERYIVRRATVQGGPYLVLQDGITSRSFTDEQPEPEIRNFYTVTSAAGDLESVSSNIVEASVPPGVPVRPLVTIRENQLILTWDTVKRVTTFKVKRSNVSGGPYALIATVTGNQYTDNSVNKGSPYYYVVSSVGGNSESSDSPEGFGVPGGTVLTWKNTPDNDSLHYAANWMENVMPKSLATLHFGQTIDSTLTNDIEGLRIARLQFESDANSYTIGGNSINMRNDIFSSGSGIQTLTMPVTIDTLLHINTTNILGTVALTGLISGPGSIMKSGLGLLDLKGANTYSGNTIVNGTTGGWGPKNAINIAGIGTGTPSAPISGPLGRGKVILNGGALNTNEEATLYNDIEVTAGKRSYLYQSSGGMNLRGRLKGSGEIEENGNTATGLNLFGDNSEFSGTFRAVLRSGNQRVRFQVPESGSAKAFWLLDATGNDAQGIGFANGTLHLGGLAGRASFRANAGGAPVVSIGALNGLSNFIGNFNNFLHIEKVGTGTMIFAGNNNYTGNTTVKNGKFLLNNNAETGTFFSPVIVEAGAFGGTGRSSAGATIGTGSGMGAILEPGNEGVGTLLLSSVKMNKDARFDVQLDLAAKKADKLTVNGVSLAGNPVLSVTNLGGLAENGAQFVIVENTGTGEVVGAFKDLPEMSLVDASGALFRISYKGGTGNDIVLMDDRTAPMVITSRTVDSVLQNVAYRYQITAIKSPDKYTAQGLPAGLNLDPLTGLISGRATVTGSYTVTVTASNSTLADTALLQLIVVKPEISAAIAAAGDGRVKLEWNPIKTPNYSVRRSTSAAGPFTELVRAGLPVYTDLQVSNGTRYYYTISATDSAGTVFESPVLSALPRAGQLVYLKFDESGGIKAVDSWGGMHAQLALGASRGPGKFGQALKLDGTANSYATLPPGVLAGVSDFTISGTVRMDQLTTWMRMFDFGSGPSQYMFFSVQAGLNANRSIIRFGTKNGTAAEQSISYNYAFPLNTQTTLAITRKLNTTTLYINGAAVATSTNILIKPADLGATSLNYLGKSQFNDPLFKGSIDEFKIYNRALTAEEMAMDMKGEQAILFAPLAAKEIGDEEFGLDATTTSGLQVSFSSSDSTIVRINGKRVRILSAGEVAITASQNGNSDFTAAPEAVQKLIIRKKVQTITFEQLSSKYPGDDDLQLTAFASSGLPVVFSSDRPEVAEVIDGKLRFRSPGLAVISARQPGNQSYRDTFTNRTVLVRSLNLKMMTTDGDNGQVSNNQIKPKIRLLNQDSIAVAYDQLSFRYWLTPENYNGLKAFIDYAQLGNGKISAQYIPLDKPRNKALGYVLFTFNTQGAFLLPGGSSGNIEARIANADWSNLNEADDHSYLSSAMFTDNDRVTLYRRGMLIAGTEPQEIPEQKAFRVVAENRSNGINTISLNLSIENTGNVAVAYKDVTLRYFFTNEGARSLNYWVDYAKKGSQLFSGSFADLFPANANADKFFELRIDPSAGQLHPLSSSGEIQVRIAKSDWSGFDQSNDHSYQQGALKENPKICVYLSGQLVYGTEPGVTVPAPAKATAGFSSFAATAEESKTTTNTDEQELIVRSAVSPNGDGINDVLVIDGVERKPDNRLVVMNSGGTKVYETRNYDNQVSAFNGRSNITGSVLRPGTYFYLFEFKDRGVSKRKTGYFLLKY